LHDNGIYLPLTGIYLPVIGFLLKEFAVIGIMRVLSGGWV